jgi:hypothetical protein
LGTASMAEHSFHTEYACLVQKVQEFVALAGQRFRRARSPRPRIGASLF